MKDEADQGRVRERLERLGFEVAYSRTELDYTVDTEGYRCRAHGLIVRFRRVTEEGQQRIILTFKRKLRNAGFVDAEESEMFLDDPNWQVWAYINKILRDEVGLVLPDDILGSNDFMTVVEQMFAQGFNHFRILLEKRRTLLRRGDIVATIDELPGQIGRFMELEAYNEEQLRAVIAELGLRDKDMLNMDYGDLIMEYNGSRDLRGRTAVFDEDVKQGIHRLVGYRAW